MFPDEKINIFGFARTVVVQQDLRVTHQDALPLLVVLVLGSESRTNDLLWRNAVHLLRVGANEVLPAAGHDVGFVAVVAQITHAL